MKRYYRVRTLFNIQSCVIPLDMPDGMYVMQLIFSNKKKALSFLKDQDLGKEFLEEIYIGSEKNSSG